MQRRFLGHLTAMWCAAAALGCGNGDDSTVVQGEAGTDVTASPDAAADVAGERGSVVDASEAGADAAEAGEDAGDAAVPRRLLLSYNGTTKSELAVFGLESKAVDGDLVYPGFIGTTYTTASEPWLLEQASDVVARLDRRRPWVVGSSWNVAMSDRADGGAAYSDPVAVVVGAGTKAYVLRYTRNDIAILDTSHTADAGLPVGSIDLAGQVQASGDGVVEMSAGVYVASKQIVYVVLANIDKGNVACNGYCLLCAATHPTVIGIDVAHDTLVDLNGSAPGVALALTGYDPAFGPSAVAYDAQADRLLVLHAGCNQAGVDGGVGPLVGREVEELSLFTGSTRTLLDLTSKGFPVQLTYVDAHRAILQLDTAYTWDPTVASLGPAIANAPDAFVWDGVGSLLGVTARYSGDGGLTGYDVVSVRVADGAETKLGTNPFSLTDGFVGGVQLWPAP